MSRERKEGRNEGRDNEGRVFRNTRMIKEKKKKARKKEKDYENDVQEDESEKE